MSTKEKALKIILVVVILCALSFFPLFFSSGQRANVSSFFGPDNRNETVLRAQTILKQLDMYEGNLSGLFGLRTRFALYRFQESRGLNRSGILDIPTQALLFAEVFPEDEEEIFVPIDYTDEGNRFLGDWLVHEFERQGKPLELQGRLTELEEPIFYGNTSTRFLLTTEGESYAISNISTRELNFFVNKNVSVSGFYMGYHEGGNNSSDPSVAIPLSSPVSTVFINYMTSSDPIPAILVSYTEEGNIYLRKWVRKVYGELTESPMNFSGRLTEEEAAQYVPGGSFTRFVLTTSTGERYSVENISYGALAAFGGQQVMIRGVLLANLNNMGLQTIVINYIP